MHSRKKLTRKKILTFLHENSEISPQLLPLIPHRWKKLGHVLILYLPPELQPYYHDIGEAFLHAIPGIKTVVARTGKTTEPFRKPTYTIIAGDPNCETIYKENGVKYKLDACNLTFSLGNLHERERLAEIAKKIKSKHLVLDMFCCVGNLSMPMAVYNKNIFVTGIEINPQAYEYLKENIRLNHVEPQFTPILGDNRKVDIERKYDRILMGYFKIDKEQIKKALWALNPYRGGWIHLHDATALNKSSLAFKNFIRVLRKEYPNYSLSTVYLRHVKWIGPKYRHLVFDIKIEKSS